ncbi:hypothetical protein CO676_32825 [Sinorhizobium sp. BJ1]|nr:hypothetical protein CO676_32825 [Sinorhizobium sp. BJ1]
MMNRRPLIPSGADVGSGADLSISPGPAAVTALEPALRCSTGDKKTAPDKLDNNHCGWRRTGPLLADDVIVGSWKLVDVFADGRCEESACVRELMRPVLLSKALKGCREI